MIVVRDIYVRHSYAKAVLLNTELKWTMLVEEPPAHWHRKTPYRLPDAVPTALAIGKLLGDIAERLLTRTHAVLR